jgi:hypothetical protein
MTDSNGNNSKNWTIRSQVPKPVYTKGKEKVQRLDRCGLEETGNL